jgi:hypothetical protein
VTRSRERATEKRGKGKREKERRMRGRGDVECGIVTSPLILAWISARAGHQASALRKSRRVGNFLNHS